MKAIGYYKSLPIDNLLALIDLDVAEPEVGDNDLLVEVRAVSVNPVDAKTRMGSAPSDGNPRILGFDGAGIVRRIGKSVTDFKPGDDVFYAGAINRQGSNAALEAIDHRIVAKKPQSLDFTAAAAMPLTALTAWEMLFDRLAIQIPVHGGKNIFLMVGAAGGVGSMAIQLAKRKHDITVIATASRQESKDWALKMGADHIINYKQPMADQLKKLGIENVDFIFSTAGSSTYQPQYANIISPQGRIGLIDGPTSFDIVPFKPKSVSIHWESMFTRSLFTTSDISRQGQILSEVAAMIDNGTLQPTGTQVLSPFNAATLRKAHQLIESGQSIGKIVIEGF